MSVLRLTTRVALLLSSLFCAESFFAQQNPPEHSSPSTAATAPRPTETWIYRHVEGIGDDVKIHFEYNAAYDDFVLSDSDRDLLARASPAPAADRINYHAIMFKDLEALVVARVVRNQVPISKRTEFVSLTHATTLAKVYIQIHCEACNRESQDVIAYPLFVRVITLSGRVVQTSEWTVDMPAHDASKSGVSVSARADLPLMPGKYELVIAAKNSTTGALGVVRMQLHVPHLRITRNEGLRAPPLSIPASLIRRIYGRANAP